MWLECILEARGVSRAESTSLGTGANVGHGQGACSGTAPLWTMLDGLFACFAGGRRQFQRGRGVWRVALGVPLFLASHFLAVYVRAYRNTKSCYIHATEWTLKLYRYYANLLASRLIIDRVVFYASRTESCCKRVHLIPGIVHEIKTIRKE